MGSTLRNVLMTSPARRINLSPSTTLVPIGGYLAPDGVGGLGQPSAGAGTAAEHFMHNNSSRFRCGGSVSSIRMWRRDMGGGAGATLTDFRIRIWRRADEGTTNAWTAVQTTEDLAAQHNAASVGAQFTITLATPLAVERGDYYSIIFTPSAINALERKNVTGSNIYFRTTNIDSALTAFDWTGATSQASRVIPLEFLATAPSMAAYGASWTSGSIDSGTDGDGGFCVDTTAYALRGAHYALSPMGLLDSRIGTTTPVVDGGYLKGLRVQSFGIHGDEIHTINSRRSGATHALAFAHDIVNTKPACVWIDLGANDTRSDQEITPDEFYTAILELVDAARTGGIKYIILTLFGCITGLSVYSMQLADRYNEKSRAIAQLRGNIKFLDHGLVLGTARTDANTSGTITGATAATPIVITDVAHGRVSNEYVTITGVNGVPEANGTFRIVRINDDSFSLQNQYSWASVAGTGSYVSGGTWELTGYTNNRWSFAAGMGSGDDQHPTAAGYVAIARELVRQIENWS